MEMRNNKDRFQIFKIINQMQVIQMMKISLL